MSFDSFMMELRPAAYAHRGWFWPRVFKHSEEAGDLPLGGVFSSKG
jgi:hypothetical protein